jgi:uncharacterized protein
MNMAISGKLDLSDAPVVDAHCHAFNKADLFANEPTGWLDRLTLMSMCLNSSYDSDNSLINLVPEMSRNTLLTMAAKRWLAPFLKCTPEEVVKCRSVAIKKDPEKYIKSLLADQNIIGLFVDDGYPLPKIASEDFEKLISVAVHKVVRIEPLIQEAQQKTDNWVDFEACYISLLKQEAADSRTIAFKSVIAYRTGLDVGQPERSQVLESFSAWKANNWVDDRSISKPARDHLFHAALKVAGEMNLPFHIHTGGGDPDVLLPFARPSLLMPLLKQYMSHPIVMIHAGYPWLGESAFLASIFPCAYIELSVLTPWSTLYIERALEQLLGSVPTNKLFHGSDQSAEPEIHWLAAKQTKDALSRVLNRAIERDMLSLSEAKRIGIGVLSQNALKLHGLADKATI